MWTQYRSTWSVPSRCRLSSRRTGQVLAVVARGVRVRRVGRQRVLGRQHEVVTLGADELANDLLAGAVRVVDGGVDDVAAGLGVRVEHAAALLGRRTPAPVLAEGHRAQEQLRDPQAARTEEPVSHDALASASSATMKAPLQPVIDRGTHLLAVLGVKAGDRLVPLRRVDERHSGAHLELDLGDTHGRGGVGDQVPHPIRAVAAAGDEIQRPVDRREPDLDPVGPSAPPPDRGEVADRRTVEHVGIDPGRRGR